MYFSGEDAHTAAAGTAGTTQATMTSQLIRIRLSHSPPCPQGSVLSLDPDRDCPPSMTCESKFPRPGVCEVCKPGTYSLDPLASPWSVTSKYSQSGWYDPACFNCPAGGDCSAGGSIVKFKRGNWSVVQGSYKLDICPRGYKVSSSIPDWLWSDGNAQKNPILAQKNPILALHDNQICEVCSKVR